MHTIAVVGLGALGGPIAAKIRATTPHQVIGVTSKPSTAEVYRKEGLVVDWLGRKAKPVFLDNVVGHLQELPEQLDYAFVLTKADALPEVCHILKDKLKSTGLLVAFQNGYVLDIVKDIVGEERTAAASVVWSSTFDEQEQIFRVTGPGTFKLGGLSPASKLKVDTVKQILEKVFPVEATDNIRGALWSKMCINSCVTTVGAVTGLTFDQQTARKDIRNLFFQIVTETIQVGKADGVRFEKLNGTISPISLSNLSSWPPSFIKHLIMKKIGEKYKGAESSMLQSIRRGRQPEIESINGVISSVGRKHNVPTPVHDKLIELVLEIAAGKREPAIENLKEAGLLKV